MIFIYSSAHEPAPLLEQPIIEYNAEKRIRPIFKKIRKVRGKTGWLLRRYGHWFGAPKNDPEGLGHHALQIGEYVYELTREEGLVGQRLTGHQIWESTIKHAIIGWTDLSDVEIQDESLLAQAYVRGRFRGKYHIKHNNCQHFIKDLLDRIMTHHLDTASEDDVTLCSSSASTCVSEKKAVSIRESIEILRRPVTYFGSPYKARGNTTGFLGVEKKVEEMVTVKEMPCGPLLQRRMVL